MAGVVVVRCKSIPYCSFLTQADHPPFVWQLLLLKNKQWEHYSGYGGLPLVLPPWME